MGLAACNKFFVRSFVRMHYDAMTFRVTQKRMSLPNDQKIVLNGIKPANEIRVLRQTKI